MKPAPKQAVQAALPTANNKIRQKPSDRVDVTDAKQPMDGSNKALKQELKRLTLEARQTRKELKQAAAHIESLAELSSENPNPVLRVSTEGVLLYANGASQSLLEEHQAVVGQLLPEFWSTAIAQARQGNSTVELLFGKRLFLFEICRIPGKRYTNLYGRDITEQVRSDNDLSIARETAERRADEMDAIFNAIVDGVVVYDANGRVQRANQSAVELFGFDPTCEDFAGMVKALSTRGINGHPLDPALLPSARALNGKTVSRERFIVQDPRGQDIFIVASAAPLWAGDRIVGAVAAWHDVTEREHLLAEIEKHRQEAELQAAELEAVFDSMVEPVVIYDSQGQKLRKLNRAARALYGSDAVGLDRTTLMKRLNMRSVDGRSIPAKDTLMVRAFRGETISNKEYRVTDRSGRELTALASVSPLVRDGKIFGAVGVWHDVSDQRKAEETRAWLASFPELNPNPVVELDHSGNILYLNPASRKLFPDLEARGKDHPWLKGLGTVLENLRQGKYQSFTREVQVGELDYLQSFYEVAQSKHLRIYSFDITTRKRAEEALNKSLQDLEMRVQERTRELSTTNRQLQAERQRFYDVLEMLPAYVILLTPDYRATFANRYFRERFGEANGRPCYEFLFERKVPCEICQTYKVLKTGKPLEWEWVGPDKHIYAVHDFPFTDADGSRFILEMGIDVTDQKQAEAQLRLETSAMEAAANGIFITDSRGSIQWCNPAFAQMTGYDRNEVIGLNPRFLKSGRQDEAFYSHMWQTLLKGQVWHSEMVNRRKDGRLYTEDQVITPLCDEQNQITHFIAIKQDVSARKQADEALRIANAYNRSLIEASLDPLVTITPEGKIGDVNQATEKVTGYSRTELIGTDFHSYFSDPDKARAGYKQVFKTGTVRDYNLEIRNRDGSVIPVLYNASVYRDEAGKVKGVFASARDITDRKQFETQLVQAEKHAVIGRMVGSITHEINNPLQTIKNCLYLIQQDITADNPIQEPLEMATSETLRITNLVGQLRELYRPKAGSQKGSHEILDILEETHSLLIPHLNNARVQWQPLTGLQRCYVNCVRDQILEVLLNICMNAIEAMQSNGGILYVNMNVTNDWAAIIIKDTGPGIPKEVVPHLFEPFMTTKARGLGLGLSITYGIIQRHGGQIHVQSQLGQGASFTILLPLNAPVGGDEEIQHGNE